MPRILFIGDIVGRPGRSIVRDRVAELRSRWSLDFVVANAENAAGGSGLTAANAAELIECGIDALTLGDHVWDQRGFNEDIANLAAVCRPANLSTQCPGRTHLIVESGGCRLGLFTVLGRQFMKLHVECPFRKSDEVLGEIRDSVDAVITEIHAEATSEKVALGWYLDGRVTAVIGTHTHIPTADAQVLPRATAYLTDAGMTGPYRSVLGRDIAPVVSRFLDGMPRKMPVAQGDVRLCGCLVDFDDGSGSCLGITPVCLGSDEPISNAEAP